MVRIFSLQAFYQQVLQTCKWYRSKGSSNVVFVYIKFGSLDLYTLDESSPHVARGVGYSLAPLCSYGYRRIKRNRRRPQCSVHLNQKDNYTLTQWFNMLPHIWIRTWKGLYTKLILYPVWLYRRWDRLAEQGVEPKTAIVRDKDQGCHVLKCRKLKDQNRDEKRFGRKGSPGQHELRAYVLHPKP